MKHQARCQLLTCKSLAYNSRCRGTGRRIMDVAEGEYRKKSDCTSCRLATDRDDQTQVDAVHRARGRPLRLYLLAPFKPASFT